MLRSGEIINTTGRNPLEEAYREVRVRLARASCRAIQRRHRLVAGLDLLEYVTSDGREVWEVELRQLPTQPKHARLEVMRVQYPIHLARLRGQLSEIVRRRSGNYAVPADFVPFWAAYLAMEARDDRRGFRPWFRSLAYTVEQELALGWTSDAELAELVPLDLVRLMSSELEEEREAAIRAMGRMGAGG